MVKRKLICMLAVGTMVAGLLAGCSSTGNTDTETTQVSETATENETNAVTEENAAEDVTAGTEGMDNEAELASGATLIVYYSASGYTEAVANIIAQTTGGDLFELEPTEPYSDEELDWTDRNSRVSNEYEDPDSRDVALIADTVDNWESYDTVYIGYPIWWGIAAWPVNGFIEANDFTGKTVIPFCTSSSSGLGESGELLAEMAGTGEWLEGERFRSGVSEDDVTAWVESIELQ